jgi:hypothetical protein
MRLASSILHLLEACAFGAISAELPESNGGPRADEEQRKESRQKHNEIQFEVEVDFDSELEVHFLHATQTPRWGGCPPLPAEAPDPHPPFCGGLGGGIPTTGAYGGGSSPE